MRYALFLLGVSVAAQEPPLKWQKLKGECPASLDWASIDAELQFNNLNVLPHEPLNWKAKRAGALLLRIESGSEFLLDQAIKLSGYRGCVLYDPDFENWDLAGDSDVESDGGPMASSWSARAG